MRLQIESPEAMEEFGGQLGQICEEGTRIYLRGDLGTGKTTLVRGFLRARGYAGKVKSPTYTLVEPYELAGVDIFHFDLYRMNHADELAYIGYRDYFGAQSIILLEWPEKADELLASPDLLVIIHMADQGRQLEIQGQSATGQKLLLTIQQVIEE